MISCSVEAVKEYFENQSKQGFVNCVDIQIVDGSINLGFYRDLCKVEDMYDADRFTWFRLESLDYADFFKIVAFVDENADKFDYDFFEEQLVWCR